MCGKAPPFREAISQKGGYASEARRSLAENDQIAGKAEPYRTSGGTAAETEWPLTQTP